jgi:hypothetical protein
MQSCTHFVVNLTAMQAIPWHFYEEFMPESNQRFCQENINSTD